jgi:signal transduction histidine kinase
MTRLKILLFGNENKIARRLIVLVIAFSSVITLLISAVQLAFEYTELRGGMERTLDGVVIFVPSLSGSVWNFDEQQIRLTLDALKQLPTVDQVAVSTPDKDKSWTSGKGLSPHVVTRAYTLRQRVRGADTEIGTLTIVASLDVIYRQLAASALRIILSNGFKTFLVALFMVVLLRRLVTSRLEKLAHKVGALGPMLSPMEDSRHKPRTIPAHLDELDAVDWTLDDTTNDLTRAQVALRELNAELELRVEERTAALRATNEELRRSLEQLRLAQVQLVQSEKMAALGGLVAGVAHEINTPIGIGVTAASHLEMIVSDAGERYRAGQLTRGDMDEFLTNSTEAAQMVLSNLQRAAELIRSFKQVAVDQASAERRQFGLKAYLEEVLISLGPTLKRTRHVVNIECPPELQIYSEPGACSQIITNLVMNSVTHGFEDVEAGHIAIAVSAQPEGLLLRYSDDGRGIAAEHLEKIFDPFFTTKRGAGGSGLGLHIVYNLVTQALGGAIACSSTPGKGVVFEIRIPVPPMRRETVASASTGIAMA